MKNARSWGSVRIVQYLGACISIFFSFSSSIFSQCLEGNCQNGVGRFKYSSGEVYTGDFVNGKREGKGIFRFKEGGWYEGDYKNDLREGWGIYEYGNGSRYEGYWKAGKKHGTGTYFQRDGEIYDGEWQNDQRSGMGTCRYADNSRYKGQWRNDLRHGKGVFEFSVGDRYEGEYSFGRMEGHGIYYHNFGSLKGRRFDGQFINNRANGTGTLYYPDGAKVQGQFYNGLVHGWATEYKKSGEVSQSGFWQEGSLMYEGIPPSPSSSSTTVHFVLFTDRNNRNIGITADEANKYLLETLVPNLQQSGLTVNIITRTGTTFLLNELTDVLDNLPSREDDAIFFYFVGHGYNRGKDQYPTLTFGKEGAELQYRQMDLSQIHHTLSKKPHRLLITIAEACNAKKEDRLSRIQTEELTNLSPLFEFDQDLIKRLFGEMRGDFLVSSSSQGQLSIAVKGDAGFFTKSFIQALQDGLKKGKSTANWNSIFENTKKNTINMAQQHNKEQIPIISKTY